MGKGNQSKGSDKGSKASSTSTKSSGSGAKKTANNTSKKGSNNNNNNNASKTEKKTEKKGGTKINVRHILCEKHSNAMKALERLNNGEDFIKVASEMSEDKARQGGSLGWKVRGEMNGIFQEAAFSQSIGVYSSEPVKTPFGYHIILVEDKQ